MSSVLHHEMDSQTSPFSDVVGIEQHSRTLHLGQLGLPVFLGRKHDGNVYLSMSGYLF